MDEPKVLTMEEFQKLLIETVETKIRELGLDKVDRKYAIFPTKDDPDGSDLKNLTKEQKVMKFFQAVVFGDNATAKALSEGTGTEGGYLVPTEFRAAVVEKMYKEGVIRPRATVIPLTRDKMEVPAESGGVTVYWTGENSAFTESNPTFAQVVLNTNKLTGLSKMSRELFADTAVNLMDYIARLFARAFNTEEDKKFMTGSGTGEPKGLRQYTVTSVAQAGANLAADDIKELFYTLPVQYRSRASWLIHNTRIKLVDKLKDSQNRYLWADGLAGAPNTLLGRPVLEQNDIPTNLGAGSDESEIWFGDLSYYLIGDREEMGVETTTQGAGAFENHQVAFKVWERIDGQLGITDAFVKLTAVK